MAFSLRTKDATSGGGTEGASAVIAEIGFVGEFTYGGRQKDKPQAALRVVFEIDGFDKPWEQHYSVGPAEKYDVVLDGYGIESTGKASGLNKSCSAFRFFEALEAAASESGVDIDDLVPVDDDDVMSVRPLEGRTVTLTNIKFTTVGGDEKDLVVIGGVSDDAAPAKGKGAKSKGGAAKSTKAVDAATEEAVSALIEEHTSVKKGDLANLVYQAHKKDAHVKAMMNLCFKEAWIADDARPWTYDKKKGVLRAA